MDWLRWFSRMVSGAVQWLQKHFHIKTDHPISDGQRSLQHSRKLLTAGKWFKTGHDRDAPNWLFGRTCSPSEAGWVTRFITILDLLLSFGGIKRPGVEKDAALTFGRIGVDGKDNLLMFKLISCELRIAHDIAKLYVDRLKSNKNRTQRRKSIWLTQNSIPFIEQVGLIKQRWAGD